MPDQLEDWLAFQAECHPKEIELGLDRIGQVWSNLGTPQVAPLVVTVAGTNGKGSSVALLSAILDAAGYRVGAYTSPHLLRYNERIQLNGEPVSDSALCEAFAEIERSRGAIPLTYFEWGTLAAFLILADQDLDVAILEVGLGGRLDAVNLLDADVALISSIALDHQDWLGGDIESIAREKAGIMRPQKPVVFSGKDAPHAITETALQVNASLYLAHRDFDCRDGTPQGWRWYTVDQQYEPLPYPRLTGRHQLQNAAGVLMVLSLLRTQLPVDIAAIRQGLLRVELAGRQQFITGNPDWLLDVSHNPDAVAQLAAMVQQIGSSRTVAIFAVMADKDVTGIVSPMRGLFDHWLLPELAVDRALTPKDVATEISAQEPHTDIKLIPAMTTCIDQATALAGEQGLVVVFGSFFTVAEALPLLRSE